MTPLLTAATRGHQGWYCSVSQEFGGVLVAKMRAHKWTAILKNHSKSCSKTVCSPFAFISNSVVGFSETLRSTRQSFHLPKQCEGFYVCIFTLKRWMVNLIDWSLKTSFW